MYVFWSNAYFLVLTIMTPQKESAKIRRNNGQWFADGHPSLGCALTIDQRLPFSEMQRINDVLPVGVSAHKYVDGKRLTAGGVDNGALIKNKICALMHKLKAVGRVLAKERAQD